VQIDPLLPNILIRINTFPKLIYSYAAAPPQTSFIILKLQKKLLNLVTLTRNLQAP
jgi:hypothetical protein